MPTPRSVTARKAPAKAGGKRAKSYRLEQAKIDRAKKLLGVATETEAIELALDMVAFGQGLAAGTRALIGLEVEAFDTDEAVLPASRYRA
jgi:hypothetical protein